MEIVVIAAIVLAVLGFIVWPMVTRPHRAAPHTEVDADRIEARIGEYRAALRRRTVCERCLYANVESARFCAECGTRLPAAAKAPAA